MNNCEMCDGTRFQIQQATANLNGVIKDINVITGQPCNSCCSNDGDSSGDDGDSSGDDANDSPDSWWDENYQDKFYEPQPGVGIMGPN